MALLRRKNRVAGEIPTASMADVAFLLLIFFLTTTVFDEERGLQIVLPAPQENVEVSPDDVLHLMVQNDGSVRVRRGAGGAEESVRVADVAALWRREVARNSELIASVETAPDASYQHMIAVLDRLQAAQAGRVSLELLERVR
jgi:biopolymer transport protein ExbD